MNIASIRDRIKVNVERLPDPPPAAVRDGADHPDTDWEAGRANLYILEFSKSIQKRELAS